LPQTACRNPCRSSAGSSKTRLCCASVMYKKAQEGRRAIAIHALENLA
jgi:hypothetical protein